MLIILAIFAIITIFATIFGGCGTPYYAGVVMSYDLSYICGHQCGYRHQHHYYYNYGFSDYGYSNWRRGYNPYAGYYGRHQYRVQPYYNGLCRDDIAVSPLEQGTVAPKSSNLPRQLKVAFANNGNDSVRVQLFRPIDGRLEPVLVIDGVVTNQTTVAPHSYNIINLAPGKIVYFVSEHIGGGNYNEPKAKRAKINYKRDENLSKPYNISINVVYND